MPAPNVSELLTSTLWHSQREAADNVTRNNAVLTKLEASGRIKKVGGGYNLREEIAYKENDTFMYYDGAEVLNTNASQHLSAAEYDWKQAAVAVVITGKELRMNNDKEQLIDLLDSRVENAMDTMKNKIAEGVYSDGTGTGGKQIGGLRHIIPTNPAVGTVGGINAANYAFWRPVVYSCLTDGGSPASAATIEDHFMSHWVQVSRGADKPDLYLLDNDFYRYFHQAQRSIARITNPSSALVKAGFQTLQFMGAELVLDGGYGGFAPHGAFVLNTRYLKWKVHKDCYMAPLDPDKRAPVNQDLHVKLMGFMGNLTCSNRFLQGRIVA
jgi:hypothetical protein